MNYLLYNVPTQQYGGTNYYIANYYLVHSYMNSLKTLPLNTPDNPPINALKESMVKINHTTGRKCQYII